MGDESKIKEKTVDTRRLVSYFLRPVIGPERVQDREPLWAFLNEKAGVRGVLSFGPGIMKMVGRVPM